MPEHHAEVQREFERTASKYADRTAGRFDAMRVVEFARVSAGATVLEVAAGTGNFLSLFEDVAGRLIALDLTHAMLGEARNRFVDMIIVNGDGARLPFASNSVDLVASAQALHHIARPVEVLKEMRRVVRPEGRVLIVDQTAPERYEEASAMTELEMLRDPTHVASRPPSAFRIMLRAAGLKPIDERMHEQRERFSEWTPADQFPSERIARMHEFIALRGHETGMDFERVDDDWTFTRRRIMVLARCARQDR